MKAQLLQRTRLSKLSATWKTLVHSEQEPLIRAFFALAGVAQVICAVYTRAELGSTALILSISFACFLAAYTPFWGELCITCTLIVQAISPFEMEIGYLLDIMVLTITHFSYKNHDWLAVLLGTIAVFFAPLGLIRGKESLFVSISVAALYSMGLALGFWLAGIQKNYQFRDLVRRIEIQEQRNVIAQSLHDSLGNSLVQIALLSRKPCESSLEDKPFQEIQQISEQALFELRNITLKIREGAFLHDTIYCQPCSSLAAKLDVFESSLQSAGFNLQTTLQLNNEEFTLTQQQLFGDILNEISTNVMKYGNPAFPIVFIFLCDDNKINLYCANNVLKENGFAFPSSGQGLSGIKKSVSLLGGAAKTVLEDDIWSISITLPFPEGGK